MKNATSLGALQLAVKAKLMLPDLKSAEAAAGTAAPAPGKPGGKAKGFGGMRSMLQRAMPAVPVSPGRPNLKLVARQLSDAAQSDQEIIFLLKQVTAVIDGIAYTDRIQSNVQFERGPAVPLSVPQYSKAAELNPASLGAALLEAARTAPSLAAAKTALSALLLPAAPVATAEI